MSERLAGKKVLVTDADSYMGPPIVELFAAEGADVVANTDDLTQPGASENAVETAGQFDVLVANLAEAGEQMDFMHELRDDDWFGFFDRLVHPLMRLARAALPAMVERGSGKIVAVTSAAPLRGIPGAAAYCAARGAQNAFVRAAGLEVARHNVQINAIAQNYVENITYYTEEMLANEELMKRILKAIPAKRLGTGAESAELALFLASENSNFIVGQIIPFAGGWVTST
jgi:2-keto-3-deoxy-L-fuconate dehydrogenase